MSDDGPRWRTDVKTSRSRVLFSRRRHDSPDEMLLASSASLDRLHIFPRTCALFFRVLEMCECYASGLRVGSATRLSTARINHLNLHSSRSQPPNPQSRVNPIAQHSTAHQSPVQSSPVRSTCVVMDHSRPPLAAILNFLSTLVFTFFELSLKSIVAHPRPFP